MTRALLRLVVAVAVVLSTPTCVLPEREPLCGEGRGSAELFGDLACNLCASRSCCAEASACAEDSGCAELTRCYQGCSDAACFVACREVGAYDEARADALANCVAAQCEQGACVMPERAVTCTEAGTVPDVLGSYSCDICIRRNVCEAATSCAESPDCMARIACMSACDGPDLNPACFDQCRDDGLAGVGDAELFRAVALTCREECGIGKELACVGKYGWPTTTQERIEVSHRAINRIAGDAFAGLEVTACGVGPDACNGVGTPETSVTDADGVVTVNIPTASPFDQGMTYSGFRGYLRWEDPSGNPALFLPTILQHTRPEYRDRAADEVAPFAPGVLMTTFIQSIATGTDVTVDPTRGTLVGGFIDCRGTVEFFAPDVALSVDNAEDDTRIAYVNEAQIGVDFAAIATTVAGQYFAINVPVGTPTVTATHVPTEKVIARTIVNIVAGEITVLALWPQPE